MGGIPSERGAAREGGDLKGLNSLGGQFGGDGRQLFAVDRNFDRFGSGAFVEAAIGRHIGEIPCDGDLHEILPDQAAVGGIESDPAGRGEKQLAPGVSLSQATIFVGIGMNQAADVAGGNAHGPAHADHQVREILADAGLFFEDVGDGAGGGGDTFLVREAVAQ